MMILDIIYLINERRVINSDSLFHSILVHVITVLEGRKRYITTSHGHNVVRSKSILGRAFYYFISFIYFIYFGRQLIGLIRVGEGKQVCVQVQWPVGPTPHLFFPLTSSDYSSISTPPRMGC